MMRVLRRLAVGMTVPSCCGRPMTWDVIRASYVCGRCGAAQ